MPFSDDEKRRWHEEKRKREPEPPTWKPEPVAICVHCQNPFGINEGTITLEVSICDVCNGI
jgi:hypothetical protein